MDEELRNSFRAGDVIARIGGDEFAIIMIQTSEDGIRTIVRRLRDNKYNHENKNLSIAVGAALGVDDSYLPAIIRGADDKMYADLVWDVELNFPLLGLEGQDI